MAKIKEAVILIESSKLEIYDTSVKKILQFPFPANSVVNFEIVNEDILRAQVFAFFQQNKFSFSQYVIVIGNSILFQKDFSMQPPAIPQQQDAKNVQPQQPQTPITASQMQEQKQKFLDIVPFQTVISTEIPIDKGVKVVATNKEFVDLIGKVIMPDTVLKAIFPVTIFSPGNVPATVLTPDIAKRALKIDSYKRYNMFNRTDENTKHPAQKGFLKKQNKKDVAMVGVFAALLIVLGGMLIPMLLPKKTVMTKVVTKNLPAASPSPTQTPEVKIASVSSSTSANLLNSNYTVKITHTAGAILVANELKTSLEKDGFNSIVLNKVATTSAQTVIIFGPKVGSQTQDSVSQIVKQSFPDPIIQKNNSATSDILITIGAVK